MKIVEVAPANPVLRQLWYDRGGAAFCAEVFEAAPANMSDLVLARWLVERERHWINHHGGLRETVNRIEPDLVLNDAAKSELVQEWKERDRQSKDQRRQDKERYDALKSLKVNRKIYGLRSERSSIYNWINSATGVRGFLFASEVEKQKVPALRARGNQISTALEPLEKQSAELESEFMTLKRKLYPRHRKRSTRAFW